MKTKRHNHDRRGVALVTTVIVVAVLAVVAVAFMQSTSMDRLSSRTVRNYYEAQLAAEAGLATVQQLIGTAIGSDRAFIVSETNHAAGYSPVLLIGQRDATILTNMYPLISGPADQYPAITGDQASLGPYLEARTSPEPVETVNLNVGGDLIGTNASATFYRAPWVYITNVTGNQTNFLRFAFLALDEQARLNPLLHQGLASSARTNYGRSGAEIRLDSEALPLIEDEGVLEAIRDASNSIVTPDTMAFLMPDTYQDNRQFISAHGVVDEDVIPAGYLSTQGGTTNFVPYPDAGKPKYNINDLATDSVHGADATNRAAKIAGIITTNLPDFHQRDLGSLLAGLDASTYPNRLAASIVDYVDNDTVPTKANNGEPAGRELAPYVVMVAEKNEWTDEQPPPPASNNITVTIETTFYIQLWNPHTVAVSGDVALEVANRQYLELRGGGPQTDFEEYSSKPETVTLQPNEMKAVAFEPATQDFVNPAVRPSAKKETYPTWPTTSSGSSDLTGHPQFRLTWNGELLDMNRQNPEMPSPARSGLARSTPGNQFGPVNAIRWAFNFSPANTPNTVGDPRGSFATESDWSGAANIATALWQGRQNATAGRSQDFAATWASRDYVRANIPQGTALSSSNDNPADIATTYDAAAALSAPVFLRNSEMVSIAELGHIFDPAQVNDSGTNAVTAAQSSFRPGGGRSFRIGQPESPFWNQGGKRAIQLLDLFSVNLLGTNIVELGTTAYTNTPIMRGRVNVNTAPPEVLSAVFEGVSVSSDEGLPPAEVVVTNIVNALVTNRPFSRISDLHKAIPAFANGTNFSPAVTNVTVTNTNATSPNVMAAMDRAREELFARTVNLLGTQSRAFRVYVVGQALDRQTNAVSQCVLEAALELATSTNTVSGLEQKIIFKKIH